MLYTIEGKTVRERLWDETISELKFAGVLETLESMKSS